jgi:hypothetical protein
MPAPSKWAIRLAEDLREVGERLGYQSTVEGLPAQGSKLKIDVVWRISTAGTKGSGFLIPSEIVIVSIEIQYSESPASISHGLVKSQYANSLPYNN